MLDYKNTCQAIINNVDENDRKTYRLYNRPQVRYATFINQSGLYQLILSSKKEKAMNISEDGLLMKYYPQLEIWSIQII